MRSWKEWETEASSVVHENSNGMLFSENFLCFATILYQLNPPLDIDSTDFSLVKLNSLVQTNHKFYVHIAQYELFQPNLLDCSTAL